MPVSAATDQQAAGVYRSSSFRVQDRAELLALAAAHPFATLVVVEGGRPYATQLPLHVHERIDGTLQVIGHCSRANNFWQQASRADEVLVLFSGPDAYVSPSWYPEKKANHKVVPTWNYATVHMRGKLRLVAGDAEQARGATPEARAVLDKLVDAHERTMPVPWKVTDAPPKYIDTLHRLIVVFAIDVTSVVGAYKLSQNKPSATYAAVADGLVQRAGAAEATEAERQRAANTARTMQRVAKL